MANIINTDALNSVLNILWEQHAGETIARQIADADLLSHINTINTRLTDIENMLIVMQTQINNIKQFHTYWANDLSSALTYSQQHPEVLVLVSE